MCTNKVFIFVIFVIYLYIYIDTNIYYFLCQVNNVLSIIQWSRPSVPGYSWGKEWRWSEVPTVKYFFFYLNQIGSSKGLPINSRFLPNDRPTRSMYTIMSIIKKRTILGQQIKIVKPVVGPWMRIPISIWVVLRRVSIPTRMSTKYKYIYIMYSFMLVCESSCSMSNKN